MTRKEEIRLLAEQDLLFFIKLVAPHRVLGGVHEEVIEWWTKEGHGDHQLLLLPRDHQKSALVAYRTAWQLTRNPAETFLYISATSTLAEKQLFFIKQILTSKTYRFYWPEMVNKEESRREKWTNTEISVDHPKRKAEGIRDPSIFCAGLTTTITGLHFTKAVLDDVVVRENAYTEEGRTRVREQYSLLASIETTGAEEWVVGTRYHPADLYNDLITMEHPVYTDDGSVEGIKEVYDVMQRTVETSGDGTGEFLWPKQQRKDGKWFGFDANILAQKRAKYLDKSQYYSQYYNDPNDPSTERVDRNRFQYYDKKFLTNEYGVWFFLENRLNVVAAIDFAFTLSKKADYTAIVVVGVDKERNIYVLDIDRFKTEKISEYFEHIVKMHGRWGFRTLRAETTVGQKAIVKELKNGYIKPNGLALTIDEFHPGRQQGSKEERISAILEPRYDNLNIWHYRGGNCQILEDEVVMARPPHDDVKDAFASAVDIAIPPQMGRRKKLSDTVIYSSRFGGVAA